MGLGGQDGAVTWLWLPLQQGAMPADSAHTRRLEVSEPLLAWQDVGARRAALLTGACFAIAVLALVWMGTGPYWVLSVGGPISVGLNLLAWRLPGLRPAQRILVPGTTLFLVGGLGLLRSGLMLPAANMALATAVLLQAIYGSRRTLLLALVSALAVYGTGATGPVFGDWADANMRPERWQNWIRLSLTVSVVMGLNVAMVLEVLTTATHSVRTLADSRMRVARVRSELQRELERFDEASLLVSEAGSVEELGRAAGAVAHDLNNALTTVLGWCELLLEETTTDEDFRLATQELQASIEVASELVGRLHGHAEPATEPLDLGRELRGAMPALRALCGNRVALLLETGPETGAVLGRTDLRRVVVSLVGNAVEALEGRGMVRVSVERDGGQVRLDVLDDGVGMDGETRLRAVEPFFSTRSGSAGLGLYNVQQTVERTGGHLEIQSAPGAGTRVTLRWPAVALPAPVETPSHALPTSRGGGGRVLFAEDDELVSRMVVRLLRRAGFEVTICHDGDQAMQALTESGAWDLFVTDGVMPGVPTQDVIEAFRARCPGVPVLLISGHVPDTLGPVASSTGVRFLAKPFSAGQLFDAIGALPA